MNHATRLAKIKRMSIAGNAYSDQQIFDKLDVVIKDATAPLKVRLAALHHIDTVMGVKCPYPTKSELDTYIRDTTA